MKKLFLNHLKELYDEIDSQISSSGIIKKSNMCGICFQCCLSLYRFPVSSLEIAFMKDRYPDSSHPSEFIIFLNGQLKKPDGSKAPCPYYKTDRCSVYDGRPMACRLYGLSPFRPLYDSCVFIDVKDKAHSIWRNLTPLFRRFIDLRFEYCEVNLERMQPVTITDFLDRGNIYLVRKSYEAAFNQFREAMRLNPADPSTYTYFGTFYEQTGQYEKALEAYNHTLSLDPLDYNTRIRTGFLLHGLQRYAEAEEHYRKALSIDPGNAQAWGNIGLICISTSRLAEAEEAYRKAIEIEPGNSIYHVCLGNVFYAGSDIERTIESMEKALSINPEDELAFLCLGSVYEKKGELEKSVASYNKYIEHSRDEERIKAIREKIQSLLALQKQV